MRAIMAMGVMVSWASVRPFVASGQAAVAVSPAGMCWTTAGSACSRRGPAHPGRPGQALDVPLDHWPDGVPDGAPATMSRSDVAADILQMHVHLHEQVR